MMDTLKSMGSSGPATATEYFTMSFLELCASILLMFIFASFLMLIVKYIATKRCQKVIPNSTTNETVTVIESRLPDAVWFAISIAIFVGSILVVRGAFGASIALGVTSRMGLMVFLEMVISFGVLAATVPKFGTVFAEKMAYNIIKSQLSDKKSATVTPEEYMKMGTPEP